MGLGQGTVSRVYRASLPLLGHQEYAVKLLRERCKPGEVSIFLGECSKVKRLGTHLHLVPLYFAGRDRRLGRYYVAMELGQGPTTSQVLAVTPAYQLPAVRTVRIATQIALGLEHAHQRGILHLDVKPSNILLEANGDLVKLTDFGSAQLHKEIPTHGTPDQASSPAYRAWEQTPAAAQAGQATSTSENWARAERAGPGPVETYLGRVRSGHHPPGHPMWPSTFDLA